MIRTWVASTRAPTYCIGLIAFMPVFTVLISRAQAQVDVNLKDYVLQSTGGESLCTANFSQCLTGYLLSDNEYVNFYAFPNGPALINYTARTTGKGVNGGFYIGVVRNDSNNQLSCFSNPGKSCIAPPNNDYLPEGLPEQLLLNVASAQDDTNASNADGTPKSLIAGSKDITGNQAFGVNSMNMSTCQQTYLGLVGNDVSAVYVQGLPFGGNVGTQDAVVIQEVETAYNGTVANSHPDHIERYYYVHGFGRVREATASYSTSTGQFTNSEGNNAIRNTLSPAINVPPNYCPQGSAAY